MRVNDLVEQARQGEAEMAISPTLPDQPDISDDVIQQFTANFPDAEITLVRDASAEPVSNQVLQQDQPGEKSYGEIVGIDGLLLVHGLDVRKTRWSSVIGSCFTVQEVAVEPVGLRRFNLARRFLGKKYEARVEVQVKPWDILLEEYYHPDLVRSPGAFGAFRHYDTAGERSALRSLTSRNLKEGKLNELSQPEIFKRLIGKEHSLDFDEEKSLWWHLLYLPEDGAAQEPLARPVSLEVPTDARIYDALTVIFRFFKHAQVEDIRDTLMLPLTSNEYREEWIARKMASYLEVTRRAREVQQPQIGGEYTQESGYSFGVGTAGGSS